MPSLREITVFAHALNAIDNEEFALLYDVNKPKSPRIPFWRYEDFDLDRMTDDECLAEFRFFRNDIYNLAEILELPGEIKCYNGLKVGNIEGLCIFLKRFAYPCRYIDMIHRFARPEPQLCMISNQVLNVIHERWHHLLTDLNQAWLQPENLEEFATVIHQKGAALNNCWGFIDGTVRPVARPGRLQRTLYNGHKKVHAIKFQSIATPSGMIANLYGPVEGKRHDSAMLAQSGILNMLQQCSFNMQGDILCIYGDPAYPLRPQLQGPFRGAVVTEQQKQWNKYMSQVRIAVEWLFGDIVNYFKFLDFKKNLKVHLSAVGKMYVVCALIENARACLYGKQQQNTLALTHPLYTITSCK
ncbi:uncharacterized protein LOC124434526 [Xenia sp. Carnegie-2017]|uniref:uncharacterized protein LOC124434526 n=1 Tax=Xenia sp. Carnegie-2017 TaxID=2897299 RepID=UPI001F048D9F|nr:uncharacterized protein LOC124434526 [Xenia sp. Carnegie-2017]